VAVQFGRWLALVGRLGVGFSVVSTTNDVPNPGGPFETFTIDAFVGMFARF